MGSTETRDALQLAPLHSLGALELLGLGVQVALTILERVRAPLEVPPLPLQRLPRAESLLLHPRDFGPTRGELVRHRDHGALAHPPGGLAPARAPSPRLQHLAYLPRHQFLS